MKESVWIDILTDNMTTKLAMDGRWSKGMSALAFLLIQSMTAPLSAQPPKLANPNATTVSAITLAPMSAPVQRLRPRNRLMKQVAAKLSGMASWYGRALQGHRTASGERFDMNEMTACHRTLPFGTRVLVTNMKNSESVIVRITDRGVLNADRIIDLSAAAADKLGMLRSGTAPVRLSVLPAS